MDKKCCVFVDGENFRRTLCDLFEGHFNPNDYLPKRAEWSNFYDFLVSKIPGPILRLRTYWYVIQYIDFYPYKFPDAENETANLKQLLCKHKPFETQLDQLSGQPLVQKMREIVNTLSDSRQRMRRRFDGWITIQEGISLRHSNIEFRRAGAIWYNLFEDTLGQEKAVDVKLATDLIVLKDIYDYALIVTGDQDYVPAVQVIKDSGKIVANVSFKTRSGKRMPGGARRLNEMTDYAIEVDYSEFESFLHL